MKSYIGFYFTYFTWRHRSRDHTIRYIRFPNGAFLKLTWTWNPQL